MISVTWIYKRPNTNDPFYPADSADLSTQAVFEELRENSGLVKSYTVKESANGLTRTSVWEFEDARSYVQWILLVKNMLPDHYANRNKYLIEKGHQITGFASENIFRDPDNPESLTTTMVIG